MIDDTFSNIKEYCEKKKNYEWVYDDSKTIKFKNKDKPFDTSELCGYNKDYWNDEFIKNLLHPCEQFMSDDNCTINDGTMLHQPYNKLKASMYCNKNTCKLKNTKLYELYNLASDNTNKHGMGYVLNNSKDVYNNKDIADTILTNKDQAKEKINSIKEQLTNEMKINNVEDPNVIDKFIKKELINDKLDVSEYLKEYDDFISKDTKSTEDYSTDNKNLLISDINKILKDTTHKEYCKKNKKDCLDKKELQSYLENKGIKDTVSLNDIIKYSNTNGIDNKSRKVLREEVELYLYSIDTRLPDSKISDTNLNPLYLQQIQQIKEQYTNNDEFRNCVNLNLDEKDLTTLKNMKTLNDDNIKLITKVLRKFSELPPYNIYACMEKLDNFEPSKVCNGLLIQEYLQLIEIIMLYFDSQITIDTSDPEQVKKLMNESIPYMKTIFKNLIDYSYLYPKCKNNGENPKLKIYESIYNNLFPKTSYIKYTPFENVDIGTNFFEQFTTSLHGRIILLIFIAFIFAQIVKLFTNQPVEVPVK